MLFRQDLGRCHQGPLTTGINGGKECGDGNNGLTAADIPLHQPGHRLIPAEISADFCQNTLLGSRQGEWKQLQKVLKQRIAPDRKRWSRATGQLAATLQQAQLQKQELVKDQAVACRTQALLVGGPMDLVQRLRQRNQSLAGLNVLRERITPVARRSHHRTDQVA